MILKVVDALKALRRTDPDSEASGYNRVIAGWFPIACGV